MAVKAVVLVQSVEYDPGNSGKFKCVLSIAGLDTTNPVNVPVGLDNVSPTIAALFLEADIKQFVKDYLTNNFGYTFGLLDTVRLLGALL